MKIRSAMTQHVEVIEPNRSITEAAKMMERLDVGVVPVCENDKLIGMVTDRDVVVRVLAKERDPDTTTVSECMTSPVFFCYDNQDITEAIDIMEQRQIRRLCVLNQSNRLVGILSLGDIATSTHRRELAGELIEKVSEPSEPKAA